MLLNSRARAFKAWINLKQNLELLLRSFKHNSDVKKFYFATDILRNIFVYFLYQSELMLNMIML